MVRLTHDGKQQLPRNISIDCTLYIGQLGNVTTLHIIWCTAFGALQCTGDGRVTKYLIPLSWKISPVENNPHGSQ